jgi:hypothetical protein
MLVGERRDVDERYWLIAYPIGRAPDAARGLGQHGVCARLRFRFQASASSGSWAGDSVWSRSRAVCLALVAEKQASVGPLAAGHHMLPYPCGQLHDADIGPVGMAARDLQHLVNERLFADSYVNRLGCLVLLFGYTDFGLCLVFRLILQLDRLKQRGSGLEVRNIRESLFQPVAMFFERV